MKNSNECLASIIERNHALHAAAAKSVHCLIIVTNPDYVMWSTLGQLEVNCLLDEVCVLIFVYQHMGNPWLIDITSDTVPETLSGRRLQELEKPDLQLREDRNTVAKGKSEA